MSPRIVSFGELLIDFVALQRDVAVGYATQFEKAAGGAPANVAVALAKLGVDVAFITQLGNDPFGHFLEETVRQNGVDTGGIVFTDAARTALAFVSVEASGERSFAFYRLPSADMLMTPAQLNHAIISQCRIFHFGSITLIDEPVRSTTLHAIKIARESGALISYDPNLRLALWQSREAAKDGMMAGLQQAQIVKMNEEELAFLTGFAELTTLEALVEAVRRLWHSGLRLVAITRGAQGSLAVTPDSQWLAEGFNVKVEDTIGAGDGFMAGLLCSLLPFVKDGNLNHVKVAENMPQVLRYANAVGALTTTQRGGIPALPTAAAVEVFLSAK